MIRSGLSGHRAGPQGRIEVLALWSFSFWLLAFWPLASGTLAFFFNLELL